MSRWARNPPGGAKVKLVLGILVICLILFLIERFIGWPDFLSPEQHGRRLRLN